MVIRPRLDLDCWPPSRQVFRFRRHNQSPRRPGLGCRRPGHHRQTDGRACLPGAGLGGVVQHQQSCRPWQPFPQAGNHQYGRGRHFLQVQANLQVNANIFQYQWNDIIRFVPNATANTGATAANSGKQHGQGLELDATWDATRSLRLIGSISVQHSIDEATHQDAGLAPHQRYFLQATWRPVPLWVIDANINHVMDRKRWPGDTRAALPDYTAVGLGSSPRAHVWQLGIACRSEQSLR